MIDETKAGFPFSVFVSVKLVRQVDEELKEFETSIRTYPEVVDCCLTTGNRDCLLRIAARDTSELEHP